MTDEPIYSVAINGGAAQECEALNLDPVSLAEVNGATGMLVMTQTRQIGEAPALQRGQSVRFFVDGVGKFSGTVLDPRHSYGGDSVTTSFRIANWWREMERMPWTFSPWGFKPNGSTILISGITHQVGYDDDAGTTPPTIGSELINTGKTFLFPFYVSPIDSIAYPTSVKEQVEALFQYMLNRRPGLVVPPVLAFGGSYSPQYRQVQDLKVADALTQALIVTPSASFWTDYTGATPVVHCIDALAGASRDFTIGQWPLKDMDAEALQELVPDGVFLRLGADTWSGGAEVLPGYQLPVYKQKYPTATRQDQDNVLSLSLDASDLIQNLWEPMLAQKLFEQLSPLRGQGGAVFDDKGLTLGFHPGDRLTFTGDHASVQHGQLVAQEVRHTFATGETAVSFGFPRALSLDGVKDQQGLLYRSYWGYSVKPRSALPGNGV